MAEVRLRVGKGAFFNTSFKNTYKPSHICVGGKRGTSAIQIASQQTVNGSVGAKNIPEQNNRLQTWTLKPKLTLAQAWTLTLAQTPRIIPQEDLEVNPNSRTSLTNSVLLNELCHVDPNGFTACHGEELLLVKVCYDDKLLYKCSKEVTQRWVYPRSTSQMTTTQGFRWSFLTGSLLLAQHQNRRDQRGSIWTMVKFLNRKPQQINMSSKPGHGVCGQLWFSRSYGNHNTFDEPLYKTRSGYYDVLQVPPNATHAQIKTAYYKQSFIYHPDKNSGSEDATLRFSEISEAYNVLGNKGLRKKYDMGILSQGDLLGASGSQSSQYTPGSSASSQQTRARHSPAMGADRKNIFDFDKFFKSHYGDQLQREKELRMRKEEREKKAAKGMEGWEMGRFLEVCAIVLVAMGMALIVSLRRGK